MDDIRSVGRPMIILTGGEPTLREDFYDIARAGRDRGFRMVAAPNGTRVDESVAGRMKEAGIQRVSISLDAADPDLHDQFRGVPGAFQGAVAGIGACRAAGLPFQVNSSITVANVDQLGSLLELAVDLGAAAFHVFLLVTVGRGHDLVGQEVPAAAQESILNWLYEQRMRSPIQVRATCAPHFYRILRQRAAKEARPVTTDRFGMDALTRGCLAGRGFVFISSHGDVQPCGYLPIACGNVLVDRFRRVWEGSETLRLLRDDRALKGKCGCCEYVTVCGGCRARAHARTGDMLAPEPFCDYRPAAVPCAPEP